MLKGTTKIELTNVKTGEKETIEKHNMVTNALSTLYQPKLGHLTQESTLRGFTPCYHTMMGGLLLFDGSITENADRIYAPAGVNVTGCARYNQVNTGTGRTQGSYNLTESKYDSSAKKMTYVYDFNTSQGNGTVASVCLTNIDAGYGAYGCDIVTLQSLNRSLFSTPMNYLVGGRDQYSGISVGTYEHLFYIDPEADIGYYFTVTDSTHLSITKRMLRLKTFSLFNNNLKVMEKLELQVLEKAIGNYKCYNFDPDENALYIFSASSSTVAINSTFMVTKIDLSTWAVTQYTLSNTGDAAFASSSRWAFAHKGYCYIWSSSSPYSCYKIEIANTVNITKLTGTASSYCAPMYAHDGLVHYQYISSSGSSIQSGTRQYIADSENNSLKLSGNGYVIAFSYSKYYYSPSMTPVKDMPLVFYCSLGSNVTPSFYYLTNYLATINNLTEPVVKTSDKTMKVTYIIEEA